MTSQTNPDDKFEIEIYTPLAPQKLADILAQPDSPVSIDRYDASIDKYDDGDVDISFPLKGSDYFIGGGMIEDYTPDSLHYLIKETMEGEPRSSIWLDDECVRVPDIFIPSFKPVIDYLKSRGIEFCLVGVCLVGFCMDEERHPTLIGHYRDGETVINKNCKYEHKELLE